ncbi:MAG: MotA/TolQ/ExbB proton channel family protein [Fibrobacter sp.]|nr:MotA/TolQ/ExbB proton channel family protein [Fibrobacter sp.]
MINMLNSVIEIICQGGWIMLPVVGASLLVWFLGLFKIYQLICFHRARKIFRSELHNIIKVRKQIKTGEYCHDYLLTRIDSLSEPASHIKELSEEFSLVSGFFLNQGLCTMKVLISVAPLLGLLGTVVGMIKTFDLITLFGAGNPALTAEGISVALVTTEAGLIVALPGLLLHNFISGRIAKVKKAVDFDHTELIQSFRSAASGKSLK